jgi:hypothetical protein
LHFLIDRIRFDVHHTTPSVIILNELLCINTI